jgi:predicted PurR-regulated permease PerM
MAEQGSGPSTSTVVRITLTIVGVLLLVYGVYLIREIAVLVIVALFLAIGLDPFVRGMMRMKFPRGLAVAAVFLLAVIIIGAFVASITPPLVRQTQRLAVSVPELAQDLSDRSPRFRDWNERFDVSERVRSAVQDLPSIAASSAGSALGVVRSVGKAFFSILTVAILAIYFMLDLPKLLDGGAKLVAKSRRERAKQLADIVYKRISGYMMGQIVVSLVAGITSTIALTLLGVPYSLPLGIWVGLSALIPMVGATIGAIPAVIVAFFGSFWTGMGTVIFFLVYQQVENYVVSPRVMRQAVDISPAAVILAALIGATLLGFVGALLAIPIAASLKVITQEVWLPRQDAV